MRFGVVSRVYLLCTSPRGGGGATACGDCGWRDSASFGEHLGIRFPIE